MSPFPFALVLVASLAASCAAPLIQGGDVTAAPDAAPQSSIAPERLARTALLFGNRALDEDTWAPIENQLSLGIEYSSLNTAEGVGYELGLNGSYDDVGNTGSRLEMQTVELYGGARLQAATGRARPFVGLGLSLVHVDVEANLGFARGSESDVAIGGYIHAGVNFAISPKADFVLDIRKRLGSNLDFSGLEADIDFWVLSAGIAF